MGPWNLTSTMCPVLILPPLAMLWINVSSRSMISVFLGVSVLCVRIYEGWRLGTSGLGAAGARGYFSFVAAGLDGDLREFATAATLSSCVWEDCELFDICLVRLRESPLCSLIRMDLFAGAVSSLSFEVAEAVLERVFRAGLSSMSVEGSFSESESDVRAFAEEEAGNWSRCLSLGLSFGFSR